MLDDELTQKIIKCAYDVYNKLGSGFLEKVYQNAMVIETAKKELTVKAQHPIKVYDDDEVIGDYIADLWINDTIIVELKAVQSLTREHEIQLVNYLAATGVETGLLINFGSPSVQVRRKFRTYKSKNPLVNLAENLINPV